MSPDETGDALDRPVRVRDFTILVGLWAEVKPADVVAAHNAQTADPADHLVRQGDLIPAAETLALMLQRDGARQALEGSEDGRLRGEQKLARTQVERDGARADAEAWRTSAMGNDEACTRLASERDKARAERDAIARDRDEARAEMERLKSALRQVDSPGRWIDRRKIARKALGER